MKLLALFLLFPAIVFAEENPQRIHDPLSIPQESPVVAVPVERMSESQKDPRDKTWLLYDNRVLKVHLRVKVSWSMMELREAENTGTASFTISRLPRVTFAVVRAPLEDTFEAYVSPAALTPLYPTLQKKTAASFAGRKGVLIKGVTEDGRYDESHFSSDGKTFYRVSFSAPSENWEESQELFKAIKRDFRWLD